MNVVLSTNEVFKLQIELDLLDIENQILNPNDPRDMKIMIKNIKRMEEIEGVLAINDSRAQFRIVREAG